VRQLSRLRHRLAAEHGFGILEAVMAAAVFLAFAGAAFAMLVDSQKRSANAERHEAAISLAQREVERLRQYGYAELGLTANPTAAAAGSSVNPDNPAEYVSGGNLRVRSNFRDRNSGPPPGVDAAGEPFVSPLTTGVSPAPQRMTSSGYSFDVHRYVTWVNLSCVMGGTDRCPGAQDGKRITVAVRPIAAQQLQAGSKPVWVTTVLTDPNSVAAGATPPSAPADPTETAQNFYLYDTRCDQTARQTLTAGHDARDTGQSLSCAGTNSLRPDLMGTTRAPGDATTLMYNYSQDYPYARIGGSSAPGLGLLPPLPASSSCPTSYAAVTAAIDKHRVHRWVTPEMPSTFTSTTRSTLTFWTRTVAGLTGEGTICVSLHKVSSAGAIVGGALATATHRLASWPVDANQVSFAFNHAGTPAAPFSLTSGQRLMLTLSLANTSLPGGIELLYDHPTYDTVLSVGTTTPLP
jgi:hypothetical protein